MARFPRNTLPSRINLTSGGNTSSRFIPSADLTIITDSRIAKDKAFLPRVNFAYRLTFSSTVFGASYTANKAFVNSSLFYKAYSGPATNSRYFLLASFK